MARAVRPRQQREDRWWRANRRPPQRPPKPTSMAATGADMAIGWRIRGRNECHAKSASSSGRLRRLRGRLSRDSLLATQTANCSSLQRAASRRRTTATRRGLPPAWQLIGNAAAEILAVRQRLERRNECLLGQAAQPVRHAGCSGCHLQRCAVDDERDGARRIDAGCGTASAKRRPGNVTARSASAGWQPAKRATWRR